MPRWTKDVKRKAWPICIGLGRPKSSGASVSGCAVKSSAKFCLAMLADCVFVTPDLYGDDVSRATVYVAELCRIHHLHRREGKSAQPELGK